MDADVPVSYLSGYLRPTLMSATRRQQRYRGIIPLKIMVVAERGPQVIHLAHTADLSPTGCRAILGNSLEVGMEVRIDYKHRRMPFRVVWCRPVENRKYEYEAGLKMLRAEPLFWGEMLPQGEEDRNAVLHRGSDTRLDAAWTTALKDVVDQ
jgi:hypothetical protein